MPAKHALTRVRSSMASNHTEFGTKSNRPRYKRKRTIFGMAKRTPDVKDLFWENTAALALEKYGPTRDGKAVNFNRLGKDAGMSASSVKRIEERADSRLETIEKVARSFGKEPWQMLLPHMDAGNQAVISIPRLANTGSMGRGRELLEHDQVIGNIVLTKEWVGNHISRPTKPENLRVIASFGDSMRPTLEDGDLCLVDIASRNPDIDGIFVLRDQSEGLLIKRVSRTARGIVVTSDNPAAPPFGALADVTIAGRVVWAWNGRKL